MNTYLHVDHATITFKTKKSVFTAVSDVDIRVAQGEFVCIIGHSGCGKSTVLNLIAGLVEPAAGGAVLSGRQISGPSPECAVVFQNHSLLPWLTCYGNVYLAVEKVFAGLESKPKLRERTLAALELVGLTHAKDQRPNEISGGMKQRVGITARRSCASCMSGRGRRRRRREAQRAPSPQPSPGGRGRISLALRERPTRSGG